MVNIRKADVELESTVVRVLDNETPQVIITESDGGTKVVAGDTVAGPGDDYKLRLSSEPSGEVNVNVYTDGSTIIKLTELPNGIVAAFAKLLTLPRSTT